MPDIKVRHPDGTYATYEGIESVSFDSATTEGERVKFVHLENPITILVEGVEYTLENASDLTETDENTYSLNIK